MLRRCLRRRRSRSRSRSEIEEKYIDHVIAVWKNAAFQREHGGNEEQIEKLINKLKKGEKETKSFNTKKLGNSTQQRKLASTSATEEKDLKDKKKSSGSEDIREHSLHEMTIGKMSVIKRHKYNTM